MSAVAQRPAVSEREASVICQASIASAAAAPAAENLCRLKIAVAAGPRRNARNRFGGRTVARGRHDGGRDRRCAAPSAPGHQDGLATRRDVVVAAAGRSRTTIAASTLPVSTAASAALTFVVGTSCGSYASHRPIAARGTPGVDAGRHGRRIADRQPANPGRGARKLLVARSTTRSGGRMSTAS